MGNHQPPAGMFFQTGYPDLVVQVEISWNITYFQQEIHYVSCHISRTNHEKSAQDLRGTRDRLSHWPGDCVQRVAARSGGGATPSVMKHGWEIIINLLDSWILIYFNGIKKNRTKCWFFLGHVWWHHLDTGHGGDHPCRVKLWSCGYWHHLCDLSLYRYNNINHPINPGTMKVRKFWVIFDRQTGMIWLIVTYLREIETTTPKSFALEILWGVMPPQVTTTWGMISVEGQMATTIQWSSAGCSCSQLGRRCPCTSRAVWMAAKSIMGSWSEMPGAKIHQDPWGITGPGIHQPFKGIKPMVKAWYAPVNEQLCSGPLLYLLYNYIIFIFIKNYTSYIYRRWWWFPYDFSQSLGFSP